MFFIPKPVPRAVKNKEKTVTNFLSNHGNLFKHWRYDDTKKLLLIF